MDIRDQVWAQIYAQEYLRHRNTIRVGHTPNENPGEWSQRAAWVADLAVEMMPQPRHVREAPSCG